MPDAPIMRGIRTADTVTATELAIEIRVHPGAMAAIGHTGEPVSMLPFAEVMPAVAVRCKSINCMMPPSAAICQLQTGFSR